jgi:hypothetical protein
MKEIEIDKACNIHREMRNARRILDGRMREPRRVWEDNKIHR